LRGLIKIQKNRPRFLRRSRTVNIRDALGGAPDSKVSRGDSLQIVTLQVQFYAFEDLRNHEFWPNESESPDGSVTGLRKLLNLSVDLANF
jgi:hypothetical protein